MNKNSKLLGILALFQLTSCATQPMSNQNAQAAGAAGGALLGGLAGGIIGHQSGRAAEGAAVGAAGGGMYGYQKGPAMFGGDGTILKTQRGN